MDSPHDPYDVVPADFCKNWGKQTIPKALAAAEAAPSTTNTAERPTCARCGSLQVETVHTKDYNDNQKPGRFRCLKQGCYYHFDEPAGENTILVTDDRAKAFDWLTLDELQESDSRTSLSEQYDAGPDDRPGECLTHAKTA